MSRIEVDNGYLKIELAPGETFVETIYEAEDLKRGELIFNSVRTAREAMDLLADTLCGKRMEDDEMMS